MSVDTLQFRLDMLQLQVRSLEREIESLRREIALAASPVNPPRTFNQLHGVWAGVVINEEDFQASRLGLPDEL